MGKPSKVRVFFVNMQYASSFSTYVHLLVSFCCDVCEADCFADTEFSVSLFLHIPILKILCEQRVVTAKVSGRLCSE